jgi:pimeloyl-ACP methyl ester carboxylesterase
MLTRTKAFVLSGVLLAAATLTLSLYRPALPIEQVHKKYVQAQSRFIEVNGVRLHYLDEGSGPETLLLVHGGGSSLFAWDAITERLKAKYRVVRLDLPGFGLSGYDPKDDYHVANWMRYVIGFAERMNLRQVIVMGHSTGAQIAWRIALERPELTKAIILSAATGFPEKDPVFWRAGQIPVVGELMSVLTPRFIVKMNLEDIFFDKSKIKDDTIDRYYEILRREGGRRAMLARMRAGDFDKHEQVPNIKIPALVLWGTHDSWVPVTHGERYAKEMSNCTLVTFSNAAHNLIEEVPDEVSKTVIEWLARQPGPEHL